MSNPQLLDIEPGGENTQYESTHVFTDEPAKQTGQLGFGQQHTKSEMKTSTDESGNNTDDDMNMARRLESEGAGGGIRGEVDKDLKPENQEATATETRDQQRYGPGSGVGA